MVELNRHPRLNNFLVAAFIGLSQTISTVRYESQTNMQQQRASVNQSYEHVVNNNEILLIVLCAP